MVTKLIRGGNGPFALIGRRLSLRGVLAKITAETWSRQCEECCSLALLQAREWFDSFPYSQTTCPSMALLHQISIFQKRASTNMPSDLSDLRNPSVETLPRRFQAVMLPLTLTTGACIWTLGTCLVAWSREVVESLGGRAQGEWNLSQEMGFKSL